MELATLHLDTYKVVQLLQEKGYTQEQAEGFMKAVQEITLSGVATKQDFVSLKQDIQDVREDLSKAIHSLEQRIVGMFMWTWGMMAVLFGVIMANALGMV